MCYRGRIKREEKMQKNIFYNMLTFKNYKYNMIIITLSQKMQ